VVSTLREHGPARYQHSVKINDVERLLADEPLWLRSISEPVLISFGVGVWDGKFFARSQYLHQDIFRDTDARYTEDEMKLLIMDAFDEERRTFERLKQKMITGTDTKEARSSIPEAVRIEVWRRDGGTCRCGSRRRLEYDHIIPLSKGGSNTARNIELLCEACNRKKSADIR
jgi:hypothetical protein